MGTPRPTDPLSVEWVTVLLLLVVAALAWVHAISPRKWKLLQESVFRLRLGRQTMREELNLQDRTLIALVALASVLIGLFIHSAGVWKGVAQPQWWRALETTVIVFVVVGAQVALLGLATFLFQSDGGAQEYIYTMITLLVAAGALLFPIDLFFAYWPALRSVLLIAGMGVLLAMLAYRWVRAYLIGSGSGTPIGYLFLYLCALEFLPLALLILSLRQALPPDGRPH
jgi:hypothetical protein